jgi:hypothetical protein
LLDDYACRAELEDRRECAKEETIRRAPLRVFLRAER